LRGSGRFARVEAEALEKRPLSIPFIAGQWSLPAPGPAARRRPPVSIPFIAGQWSLLVAPSCAPDAGRAFQSPSLRGSGRFTPGRWFSASGTSCFNPLHCGAVVASGMRLKSPHAAAWGFNPLHCGAVVASARSPQGGGARRKVSIPFIAGQWSLRRSRPSFGRSWPSFNPLHCGAVVASGVGQCSRRRRPRFNPLHCGAVVASSPARPAAPAAPRFNPLHCGAVVASLERVYGLPPEAVVSIPFIAGQWSLRTLGAATRADCADCFNPLHCGAVVASRGRRLRSAHALQVSIPFIAGQWSLLFECPLAERRGARFQSPSLRGSGRFRLHFSPAPPKAGGFNPLHCGAVVASDLFAFADRGVVLSFNPLHCGAVVASTKLWVTQLGMRLEFQSPSLRGSGRFPSPGRRRRGCWHPSFNPLHCGAVVASRQRGAPARAPAGAFQSPSLRGSGRFRCASTGSSR